MMFISLFIKKFTPYFIKKILYKNFSRLYWQSSFSNKWHKDRSQNDFELFSQVIFENTKDLNFDAVIEIGCGAGDLINCMSKKMVNCKRFMGVDINKKLINENVKLYRNIKNVNFLYSDIEDYLNKISLDKSVLLVSQNSLDYFKQERLRFIFSILYKKSVNITIAISTSEKNLESKNSKIMETHTFTAYHHNYFSLLEETGYKVRHATLNKDSKGIVVFASKNMY